MWVNKTSQQCFIQQRRCEVYQCAERQECLCSLHYFTAGAALSFHRLWPSGLFFAAPLCRSRFLLSCTSNGNQLSPPVNQLRRGRVHKQNHTISRWRRQWDSSCCQCHRVWSHLEHSGNMDLFFIPLSASFNFTLEQKSHDSVAACIWLIIQIRLKKWLNRRFSLDSELSFVDVSHLVCSKRTGCFRGNNLTFVFVEPQLEATSLVVKKTKHQFLLMLDVSRGVGLMNDAIACSWQPSTANPWPSCCDLKS